MIVRVVIAKLKKISHISTYGDMEQGINNRENPNSYAVVTGTDLINDYINDIETLLNNQ